MGKKMERITYDEVANICEFFSTVGKKPTILNIHSILEKGSNSTIANYLKKWKSEEANRKTKLSLKVIRFLEAEIENESLKMTSKDKAQNVALEKEVKALEDVLDISCNKIEDLESLVEKQRAETESIIEKLRHQIEAQKLENNSYKKKVEELQLENTEALSDTIIIKTKYALSQESGKKLEFKIEKLEKEKEKLLIQVGKLQITEGAQDKK